MVFVGSGLVGSCRGVERRRSEGAVAGRCMGEREVGRGGWVMVILFRGSV